jgi:hypothetical protein
MLSTEGQEAFISAGGTDDHSRRTDVASKDEFVLAPDDVWSDAQPTQYIQDRALALAEEHLTAE